MYTVEYYSALQITKGILKHDAKWMNLEDITLNKSSHTGTNIV